MNTEQKIEALLFALGEPLSLNDIEGYLQTTSHEIKEALEALRQTLLTRGIVLVENGEVYSLGTHKEMSFLLEKIRKEELGKELSPASLETLTIIAYLHEATRADIEYIRGVNSQFILRNLAMRGLIEKKEQQHDMRRVIYSPSLLLLADLGVSRVEELPEYEILHATLKSKLGNPQQAGKISEEEITNESYEK